MAVKIVNLLACGQRKLDGLGAGSDGGAQNGEKLANSRPMEVSKTLLSTRLTPYDQPAVIPIGYRWSCTDP
ncbi:hypothetical protein An01g02530 [Aspergillus niger]|uniref:Uncharacterized protein n=2 Tax=Aspergillus niger TaxID=5061 RepID=A2Q7Z9_ASPNC|nr:hypothetical protein An01g02530 [Aspergillus niger]CAK43622.1 hypothetical protein An01g02530 [Aspergillus niger]